MAQQRPGHRAARAGADPSRGRRRPAGQFPTPATGRSRSPRRTRPHVRREPPDAFATMPRACGVSRRAVQRAWTIPGVTAAGGISRLPATGSYHPWNTTILSGPLAGTWWSRSNGFNIQQRTISGDVFAALEIPVLAGRQFDARDDAERAVARGRERELRPAGVSRLCVRRRRRTADFRGRAEARDYWRRRRRRARCLRRTDAGRLSRASSVRGRPELGAHTGCGDGAAARTRSRAGAGRGRRAGSRVGGPSNGADDRRRRPGNQSRTIRARPDGGVRGGVAAACGARSLRGARVRACVSARGDWDPDGARRVRRSGSRAGPAAGRHRPWVGLVAWARPVRWCSAAG